MRAKVNQVFGFNRFRNLEFLAVWALGCPLFLINFEPVNFEDYLTSKKIDAAAFKSAEPQRWEAWEKEFSETHPNSFTSRNLYLINPIRRKYPLPESLKK